MEEGIAIRVGASRQVGTPVAVGKRQRFSVSSAGQHEAQGAVNVSIIFNSLLQWAEAAKGSAAVDLYAFSGT